MFKKCNIVAFKVMDNCYSWYITTRRSVIAEGPRDALC